MSRDPALTRAGCTGIPSSLFSNVGRPPLIDPEETNPDLERESLKLWVVGVATVPGHDDAAWLAVSQLETAAKALRLDVLSTVLDQDDQLVPDRTPRVRRNVSLDLVKRRLMVAGKRGLAWPEYVDIFRSGTGAGVVSDAAALNRAKVSLSRLKAMGAIVKRHDDDGTLRVFFVGMAPPASTSEPSTLQLTTAMLDAGLDVLTRFFARNHRASHEVAAAVFSAMRALEPDPEPSA